MTSTVNYVDLCRLCLVKDCVSVPIFEGEGDVRQIFLKIAACLPVKVSREDKLPQKICNECVYKVELCYEFWNTTANAEKQLLQWLGETGMEDKQSFVNNPLNPNIIKSDHRTENRLSESGLTQSSNIAGVMENIGLGMTMMITTDGQQQISSVPMENSIQTVQAVPGPSNQTSKSQSNPLRQDDDEESTEDEDNSDDDVDAGEVLPIKEEGEEDPNASRTLEPTTFVNVSLACDEAGPSGLQQQKMTEMSEMTIPQTADGESKTGYFVTKLAILPHQDPQQCNPDMKQIFNPSDSDLLIEEQLCVPKEENLDVIFSCTLCGEGFVNEDALNLHLAAHETQTEELVEPVQDDMYVCEHCGKSFTTTLMLKRHQREHGYSSDGNQDCDPCEYIESPKKVIIEETIQQDFNYKFFCETCGAGFYSLDEFQEHLLDHSREKPFQCEICNATFRYRQGLRLHTKLHQPDYVPPQKKHHCELCNKRFSRKQVLLVHMKTHGNMGPQNEYICPVCGKSVSSKTYLTVHLRKHTGEKPHVCDLCGKGFISQNYLSVHRRTHTGERPHKCTHCEKRFTQRTTLVVHLRGHTGDRPYPCTCCHKSFASKTMLNSHLKTHAKQTARQQQEQQEQQSQQSQQSDQVELNTVTILLPS